jgi:hypothetical protein
LSSRQVAAVKHNHHRPHQSPALRLDLAADVMAVDSDVRQLAPTYHSGLALGQDSKLR